MEGIWLASEKPIPELRGKDRFLDYLRVRLSNVEVIGLRQLYEDRAVELSYKKNGKVNFFYLFWKGRELVFMSCHYDREGETWRLLKSWEGAETILSDDVLINDCNKLGDLLFEVGLKESFEEKPKNSSTNIKDILNNELEKLKSLNSNKKQKSKREKKIENIQNDLKKIDQSLDLYDEINDIDFSKINGKWKYRNFKISFGYGLNDFEKRDLVYKKLKALKKARAHQESRLQIEKDKHLKINQVFEFENSLSITPPLWNANIKYLTNKKRVSEGNFQVFLLPSGIQFAVGKNTKGNDEIRSQWGSRGHLWFHLEGDKSAHIVCKVEGISQLSQEDIDIIASCLKDFSRDDKLEIRFFFTQVKNLRGIKGQAGSVLFKKEKYLKTNYKSNWKDIISD